LLGCVAAALSLPTLFLSLIAFYLFFLYTLPAVIVGNRGATEALSESARITTKNFVATLVIVVLLGIAFMVASWIAGIFHGIPLLGMVIRQLILQIVTVFATLVIVGEYIKLRSTVEAVGVGTPPTASPPPPAT
jgi:membrane-anchored glycerophosphoryl diester phosphodiesterase (GDPDase)